jgi:predicted Zn finger-like uncharacterized protein
MPVIRCSCGTRYNVPDSARGKRVRCKKCGKTFTVPAAKPAASDDLSALAEGAAIETQRPARQAAAVPAPGALPPDYAAALGGGVSTSGVAEATPLDSHVSAGQRAKAYFASIGREFLLNLKFGNLATVVVVWIIMSIQFPLMFAGCFGWIGILILEFYFMAFCMSVVVDAAAGEEDLDQPSFTAGWLEGIVWPGIKFLCAYLFVRAPAIIYLLTMLSAEKLPSEEAAPMLNALLLRMFGPIFEESATAELVTLSALYLAGSFFWPIVLLVVAVGAVRSLLRIDLIIKTIIRSFPAYLSTVVLAYFALALPMIYAAAGLAATEQSDIAGVVIGVILSGLEIYATILAMRVIGLYYHHFKHRFAWSWG